MNKEEYLKLYKLETTYWWHVGKNAILKSLLDRYLNKNSQSKNRVLDLGCGTGSLLRFLGQYGDVTGVDSSPTAIRFCKNRGLKNLKCTEVEKLTFQNNTFDLISAFDLLEHLKNDQKIIKKAHSLLKPGGYFFVSVPAHKFLWSEHDEALAHQRRYSRKELSKKIQSAGFQIEKMSYSIFFFFFPILIFRTFQNFFVKSSYPKTSYIILPDYLNNFLIFLLKVESKIITFIDLPIGVSLICLAKKVRNE